MFGAESVNSWAEQRADALNPILVKETRQVLKTKFVTVSFLIALVIAWFVSLTFAVQPSHPQSIQGPELFGRLVAVLVVALFFVVPYVSFRGMAAEREQHTFEMLSVTALSDGQIFWGKFSSALLLIALFEAAFAPFISMTYLLRGLSVLEIAAALFAVTAITVALALFGLMLGALSTSVVGQVLSGIVLLSASFVCTWGVTAAAWWGGASSLGFAPLCCIACASFAASVFFAGATQGSLRASSFGVVRTYLGREELAAITSAAHRFARKILQDFPIVEKFNSLKRTRVTVPRKTYLEIRDHCVDLERVLNPRRRHYVHLGRYRFLTIRGAALPLETICSVQNAILKQFGWTELCATDHVSLSRAQEFLVYPLIVEEIERMHDAADAITSQLNETGKLESAEVSVATTEHALGENQTS